MISDVEADIIGNESIDVQGFELSPEARAQADLKFTYVVTCQIYGKQKEDHKPEAADIALLMQRLGIFLTAFSTWIRITMLPSLSQWDIISIDITYLIKIMREYLYYQNLILITTF